MRKQLGKSVGKSWPNNHPQSCAKALACALSQNQSCVHVRHLIQLLKIHDLQGLLFCNHTFLHTHFAIIFFCLLLQCNFINFLHYFFKCSSDFFCDILTKQSQHTKTFYCDYNSAKIPNRNSNVSTNSRIIFDFPFHLVQQSQKKITTYWTFTTFFMKFSILH